MKVRSGWGRNFMEKFNTGGAENGSEPDAKLTPATKISSRPVQSGNKLASVVKTAPRCSSQRMRQETIDSNFSEKSDKQKQEEGDIKITDVYSLGEKIDITKIIHSMKRGKCSARERVKSSAPWEQMLGALNSRNVARAHWNDQGVGSKKMKRTSGGTKSWCMNNGATKGKKHVGGEGDASKQSILANLDKANSCSSDTNAIEHLPKSDTSSVSKEQHGVYAFKQSAVPTDYISSEVKDSNGATEISLEQTVVLMNNTLVDYTKNKGAFTDDLMDTTDVISLYQAKENYDKFDPATIPGLDLNDGAENFDTSTAQSALTSLYLVTGSTPDPCIEFAVKILKDEIAPPDVSEMDKLLRQKENRQKSTTAWPSQSSQGRKG